MSQLPQFFRGFAILACALMLGAGVASAHSGLKRAEPAVNSSLKRAPAEIRLQFTEQLEPAYSSVTVEDNDGERVDNDDARVDPANASLLRVSLKQLARGTYTVIWRVLSVDTHVTEGRYTFKVE